MQISHMVRCLTCKPGGEWRTFPNQVQAAGFRSAHSGHRVESTVRTCWENDGDEGAD